MRRITCEDLYKYRFISALELAPNDRSAVFCLSQPSKEVNNYKTCLWSYERDDNEVHSIDGTDMARSFCYVDSDHIVFPAVQDERDREYIDKGGFLTVFYRVNIRTMEKEEAFRVSLSGATARLIGDNLFLLSCTRNNARPDIEAMNPEERDAALGEWKDERDFEVCEEMPFVIDGQGFVNRKRHALYLYDAKTQALCALTEPNYEVSHFAVSKDGRYVAFSGVYYDRYYVRTQSIYLYDVETGEMRMLLPQGDYQIMGLDFLRSELIVAAAQWSGIGPFPNHNLYTLSLDGGEMSLQHIHSAEDFGNKSCSDCRYGAAKTFRVINNELYYLTTCDTSVYMNRWKKGESPQRICIENFIPDGFAVGKDILLTTGTTNGLQELFSFDGNALNKISNINAWLTDECMISRPAEHKFTNQDGITVSGFVMTPVDFDPQKSYPGILEIHGGPRAAFTAGFFHEMQCLTGEGYFVIYCNPRGSAGKGEAFADIRACRGTIDYQDVMEWTDSVLKQYPAIDPDRLGVMGGSYGGYLTNWCITHTNRFRAAISMRSISNIVGDYGATDFGVWGTPGVYGGTPWNNEERLRGQSPYTYAMDAVTPTLFMHSFEDYRCTLNGAMQMYAALQIKGIPTRMCLFRHEGHELSRTGAPKSRVRRLREISAWFERYLLDDMETVIKHKSNVSKI